MELTRSEEIRLMIEGGAGSVMTLPEIIAAEINDFLISPQYDIMKQADDYYRNRSDVQRKENKYKNRSNTRIEHPILKKLVDQKANYLLSKPFSVESENKAYADALTEMFDGRFRQKIKSMGKGAVKSGIAWLAPYFEDSTLKWMRLPSTEVIPLWRDAEHTELDAYIRIYPQVVYSGRNKKTITRVEYWDRQGVRKYKTIYPIPSLSTLEPDYDSDPGTNEFPHFTVNGQPYNWDAVPIVWTKYNEEELPLCYFIKELIDDVNWQTSVTADVLRVSPSSSLS